MTQNNYANINAAQSGFGSDKICRPDGDQSREPEDWFGILNDTRERCPPSGSQRLLSNKFLVILEDIYVNSATRATVLDAAVYGRAYKSIPVVEVNCTPETIEKLAKLPGVRKILPPFEGIRKARLVANGIDFLLTLSELQRNGSPSDKNLIGGRVIGEPPGYPILRDGKQGLEIAADPNLDWQVEPALMPVINISLGTFARDYPFMLNDIVNVATWGAAHNQLVVVSAGNCGRHRDVETMSAWAEAPWVLSVGATSDPDGLHLADYSSRGSPGNPESGPDLVAWGSSSLDIEMVGTSFAAPRVSVFAMICTAAILQLRHAVQVVHQKDIQGIRLVGCGFVDNYGSEMFYDPEPRNELPGLPVVGPIFDNIAEIASAALSADVSLDIRGNEGILRKMLLEAARPVPGYQQHEVGAGFLDEGIFLDYLASLNGADLLATFATGEVKPQLSAIAAEFKLFDRSELDVLARLVGDTAPVWKFDWRSQRWGSRTFKGESLDELTETERRYGIKVSWPPEPVTPT